MRLWIDYLQPFRPSNTLSEIIVSALTQKTSYIQSTMTTFSGMFTSLKIIRKQQIPPVQQPGVKEYAFNGNLLKGSRLRQSSFPLILKSTNRTLNFCILGVSPFLQLPCRPRGYLKAQMIYQILFLFFSVWNAVEWNVQPVKRTGINLPPNPLIFTPSVSIHSSSAALSKGDLDGQNYMIILSICKGLGDGFGSFPSNRNNYTNNTTLAWHGEARATIDFRALRLLRRAFLSLAYVLFPVGTRYDIIEWVAMDGWMVGWFV